MIDGLRVIQVPGAYYGRAVTLVGWLRRVRGDEWELLNARTVLRTGQYRLDGLSLLASGKTDGYQLGPIFTQPEEIHRLIIRRSLRCDEKAWAKLKKCPRPKDWKAE